MRTMYFTPPFRVSSTRPSFVAFINDGAVKKISAQREIKVVMWVIGISKRFEGWERVDCGCDVC